MASPIGEMVYKIVGDNSQFDSAIDKSDNKFKSFSQIVAKSANDIQASFKQIEGEAAVWGNSVDLIKQKQEVLKNEISKLISQGLDPLSPKIEKLQNEYFALGKEAEDLAKRQKTFNDKLGEFGTKAISIGKGLSLAVTTPLVAMAAAAIKSTATMEMLQASFTTMLGSAQKASVLMFNLKKMAAVTPFETTDLADASKTLLQFGVSADKLLPTLQMLGDIAQGNNQRFNSLALVFGQMQAAGRLMGQDLLQMINAGFNPLKVISEKTGESMASLKDKMSKGAISADEVTKAFQMATSQGGLFYKGMETASKTFDGLVSTLKDDVATMGRSFVESLMPALKEAVKGLSSVAQWVTNLDPTIKSIVLTMGAFAAAAGPVALGIGLISKALTTMNPYVLAATVAIGALAAIIGAIASESNKAKKATEGLNDALAMTADLQATQKALDDTIKKIKELQTIMAIHGGGSKQEKETLAVLEAQRASLENNIKTLTRLQNAKKEEVKTETELTDEQKKAKALQDEITAARNKSTNEYNDALALINLQVKQGQKTEKESKEDRKKAAEDYLKALDDIIIKYKLTEGATVRLANTIASTIGKDGVNIVKTRAELLGQYSEQDQQVTDIAIADVKRESDARAESFIERRKLLGSYSETDQQVTDIAISDAEREAKEKQDAALKTFTIQKNALNDYSDADKTVTDIAIEDAKRANKEKLKDYEKYIKDYVSISMDMASQLKDILDGMYQNQLDALDAETKAKLDSNDKQLQNELKAAGVQDKTAVESAQEKLDAAIAANDEEAISEAKKALTKAKIEEDFAKKEEEIKKEAAIKAHDIKVKQFKADQALSIATTTVDTAQAVIKAYSTLGPVAGSIAAAVIGALGIAQIAVIKSQQPPTLELAEGGIIPPRIGGVQATLAEAGQTEVIFPLDKLENFLSKGNISNYSNDTIPWNVTIKLSEREIYKGIFQASKNHTVLIDATAVV